MIFTHRALILMAALSMGTKLAAEPDGKDSPQHEVRREESPEKTLFAEKNRLQELRVNHDTATQRVYQHLTKVINAVRNKQNTSNSTLMKIYRDFKPLSESDERMRKAAWDFDVERKDAYPTVNKALRNETVQTMGEMLTSRLSVFQHFQKGLNFSFDFKSMFAGSKKSAKSAENRRSGDRVRYGLVLKEIIPPNKNHAVAALTSIEEEWNYAAKARPVWAVDQVEDRKSRRPLKVNIAPSRYDLNSTERAQYDQDKNIPFNLFNATTLKKAPSMRFKGNIKPRNFRNAQSLSGGVLPPLQMSLRQSESLYSMNYLTKGNFEKEKITHVFQAPIYKRLGVKRILDEEFRSLETVYQNLLISEQMPDLSIHYLNQEKRYLARFSRKNGDSQISLIAETPPEFNFGSDFGTKAGEKYKIDYSVKF